MTPTISVQTARRMALHAQGLATPPAAGTTVEQVTERIGCLQLDPVPVVARSPLLVLRARMRGGSHDAHVRALDRAAYSEHALFDYWAHEASLCHVADLPVHRWAMTSYDSRLTPARRKVGEWVAENAEFADHVVDDLRARGPLATKELEDRSASAWEWGHWTDEVSSRQTVARLTQQLWLRGRIGVADRAGPGRRWDVMERCLPPGALDAVESIGEQEAVRRSVLRAVSMLGVGRAAHITAHFTRRRYPGLDGVLAELEEAGELQQVGVEGLRGVWWARVKDLDRASSLPAGSRTVALSPFDNLLCDRARTAELFDFDHRLEIYVPAPKRRWGYYVLPILHGERLIARADLRLEEAGSALRVLALHEEPGRRAPSAVRRALTGLAHWRGAELVGLAGS